MDIRPFLSDTAMLAEVDALKQAQRTYSDIIDDQGHQYVDLVMEGGGMLGLALVGYSWVLEQVGIRFLGIGGTSAGSINALLLAALGPRAAAKSPKLLEELARLDFWSFVDGDSDARNLIQAFTAGAGKIKLAFLGAQVLDNLNEQLGLNPGKAFLDWLSGLLAGSGVHSLADLDALQAQTPPGLRLRSGQPLTAAEAGIRLAMVAADISTETKVVFPELAALYFAQPQQVNPALFARASMSIPYFFEPLQLRNLPQGPEAAAAWLQVGFDAATEKGGVPTSATLVDGGVMSNFPIDLFHIHGRVPTAPTFGVKLQYDERRRAIDGPVDLLGAIFNSARHCLDYDFLHRNPDYRQLVTWIPCQRFNWLDFAMSRKDRVALFREGAHAAIAFLKGFDWLRYKQVRAALAEAHNG